jgi:carboxyl-terminal processing protease
VSGRWRWRCVAILAVTAAVAAAPPGNPRPATATVVPDDIGEEALQFSVRLVRFVNSIRMQYYRPVSQADLLDAAMTGLYEAVNQPKPENLRSELERMTDAELMVAVARLRANLGHQEEIAGHKALLVGAGTINRALDPHCGIVGQRDFGAAAERPFFGMGIAFTNAPLPEYDPVQDLRLQLAPRPRGIRPLDASKLPAELIVKLVILGSPAQQAGIRPGDRITSIDDKPCASYSQTQYRDFFYPEQTDRGPGAHSLRIVRPDRQGELTVTATATEFWPENVAGIRRQAGGGWDCLLDEKSRIGYLRVGPIDRVAAADFRAALQDLKRREARGLILDLRWCPGGFLDSAAEVAQSLLPADQLAACTLRINQPPEPVNAPDADPVVGLPLLVLVGAETTGGGEMVAAALQDYNRGVIAGDRTFGKRSVQQTLASNPLESLFPDFKYKISRGILLRPSEFRHMNVTEANPPQSIGANPTTWAQRYAALLLAKDWCVRPDNERWLPVSREMNQQLKEWWTLQALRPAGDRTALPLDDPDADPQLSAAIKMLNAIIK